MSSTAFLSPLPEVSPPVADLDEARTARATEAALCEGRRPFLTHVIVASFATLTPSAEQDATSRSEVFAAPRRLGEIACAMVACPDRSHDHV